MKSIKNTLYFLLIWACLFGLAACATQPKSNNAVVPPAPVWIDPLPADDPHLLAKQQILRRDPESDFHQLRLSFTNTPRYRPYSSLEESLQEPMLEALGHADYAECSARAASLLDYNYGSLAGHFGAMRCAEELGDAEPAAFHRWVLDGLLDDVQSQGDGRAPEQAYITYSVNELHWVLALLGLETKTQGVVQTDQGVFDRMVVVQPGSDEELVLFFDINVQMSIGLLPLLGSETAPEEN